ncbi:CoA pyrophosphatase [Pontibacter sp. JAM-7]|uniref:CoA pyrophosphatase n=1 Tax=Pontibacter sp. JAM-7 TaxID=3366581 RepID=UPI003AF54257
MLTQIRHRLAQHEPRQLFAQRAQAGVLVALTDNVTGPEVILTRRAVRLSTHSGEVAFPGGKRDPEDIDLLHTALREAHEEVGIAPDQVDIIGPLGQVMSKHALQVTPWVGVVSADIRLTPNPGEIDQIFRVPLTFFMADHRCRTDALQFRGKTLYVPAWEFDGHIIWGLTAYVLVELLNIGCDAGIPMRPRPEHDMRYR